MKYSGFIDSILAEAAFAKKTNDASWLIGRLQAETDPIKRKLLSVVCNADFIKGMKREAGWLREQKGKLEDIAADIEDGIEEIEAEEVNDHMQSVNYQLAKAAYDDDEDEEEDSMPLKSDSDEDEDDFYSSITNGWAGASSQAADPSDPDMGIQDDPPSFKELPWDLPKIPDWYTPSDRRPEINLDSTTQDRKGEDSEKKWEQMRKEAAKKYGVYPPKDFKKWAQICEHIIKHYNEGWADGFNYGIEYWQIWNEHDHSATCCWTGTPEQFYDFYETAYRHLKKKFPHLQIGGPALIGRPSTGKDFIEAMAKRNVPLDFLSWHMYFHTVEAFKYNVNFFRKTLDENGYKDTPSFIDEWNIKPFDLNQTQYNTFCSMF